MKYLLLISVLFLIACGSNEKKNEMEEEKTVSTTPSVISARKLVSIVDDSSFATFKELSQAAGYTLADSSADERGNIIYITKENGGPGTFGVTYKKGEKVSYLEFATRDKSIFEQLKKEFVEMGATTTEHEEGVEYMVADIFIATSKAPGVGGGDEYEIMMFRDRSRK